MGLETGQSIWNANGSRKSAVPANEKHWMNHQPNYCQCHACTRTKSPVWLRQWTLYFGMSISAYVDNVLQLEAWTYPVRRHIQIVIEQRMIVTGGLRWVLSAHIVNSVRLSTVPIGY